MTTSISLQRLPQPEIPSRKKDEIEGRVPYQKVFAIAALFFLPVAAGAAGAAMPRTTPLPGLQISNATCLSLRTEPLNTYVTAGKAAYFFSESTLQAEALRRKDFREKPWDAEYTMQSRLEEKKFILFNLAAEELLAQADNEDHPAARAIGFHQAREVLEQAEALRKGHFNSDIKERFKNLRVDEAGACNLAAKLAATPQQKLEWVARGLKELKISSDPYKNYFCFFEDNFPACAAASSLWLTAARAFQALPSDETRYPYSIVPYQSDLRSRAPIAAARCLYNAAYCVRSLGNDKQALVFLNASIEIMKNMDTTNCTLRDRIQLQEEIVSTCIVARNFSPNRTDTVLKDRIYSEAMVAQEMYLQLPYKTTYHTIKRALRLEEAAYFTPNLTQSAELYREARDTVQKVWDEKPTQCRNIPEFANERDSIFEPSFTLEDSLLGRLKAATNQVEKELERKNAGLLRSVLETFSSFLSSSFSVT